MRIHRLSEILLLLACLGNNWKKCWANDLGIWRVTLKRVHPSERCHPQVGWFSQDNFLPPPVGWFCGKQNIPGVLWAQKTPTQHSSRAVSGCIHSFHCEFFLLNFRELPWEFSWHFSGSPGSLGSKSCEKDQPLRRSGKRAKAGRPLPTITKIRTIQKEQFDAFWTDSEPMCLVTSTSETKMKEMVIKVLEKRICLSKAWFSKPIWICHQTPRLFWNINLYCLLLQTLPEVASRPWFQIETLPSQHGTWK